MPAVLQSPSSVSWRCMMWAKGFDRMLCMSSRKWM